MKKYTMSIAIIAVFAGLPAEMLAVILLENCHHKCNNPLTDINLQSCR